MAIKKSELYSTLWASCDELRGGMDASQYKDYVLVLLFIKYISDKYAGQPFAPIQVPEGASFADMVKLKGKPTIGDDINKKIIGPIKDANKISDVPDFNDPNKLGNGKEMVDRLTKLIALFENPGLDFSKNRADGDDILGDAYEFLMRHFATESGKSKGQFYTPAEVSRIMARVIGINRANTTTNTSVYDPACGSGSLLLKLGDEAGKGISLFGQEMDNATAALARMNMILHNNPGALIRQGNTIANPLFTEDATHLKTFDYVVANPPFSSKAWSSGIEPANDAFSRFKAYGIPPAKNGDYAFLLHILQSLKSKGKGAVILPHGVLFRGNAEGGIRKRLIRHGYIKGVIGLPPNLFYGTGIPACIIVLDKEHAAERPGIFMIDAGKGFLKDGNKNRLREQDIHKIVDVFNRQLEIPGYSRMVPVSEISDAKNDYNLNIPRYIDSQETEDLQDIAAHLLGGIPLTDIDALNTYWEVYPSLRAKLFKPSGREGYCAITIDKSDIKSTIFHHPEFLAYSKQIHAVLEDWQTRNGNYLKSLEAGCHPKQVIHHVAENMLQTFYHRKLVDQYDVYQHLMNYYNAVMQDDLYEIAADGWKAGNEVTRLKKESKKGDREVTGIEGLEGRLIPPSLMIEVYFSEEQKAIEELVAKREMIAAGLEEIQEEYGGEEGLLAEVLNDKGNIGKPLVQKRLKELYKPKQNAKKPTLAFVTETTGESIAADNEAAYGDLYEDNKERAILEKIIALYNEEIKLDLIIREKEHDLEKAVIKKYPALTIEEIKTIVTDRKWMTAITTDVTGELQRISQRLAQRIAELAERYESKLPDITNEVNAMEEKVLAHLEQMGFVWK